MIGLVVLVAVVWAANFVVGFLFPDRSDPAINAIFAAVMSGIGVLGLGNRSGPLRRKAAAAAARLLDPRADQAPPERGDGKP